MEAKVTKTLLPHQVCAQDYSRLVQRQRIEYFCWLGDLRSRQKVTVAWIIEGQLDKFNGRVVKRKNTFDTKLF